MKHLPFTVIAWLLFLTIVILYGLIYAPFGFENNDGGFILGLSYQVHLGSSLYDNVIYVRPPVSPVLHSFVFQPPFSSAPLFFDRLFVYIQIATYSALSAILAKRIFTWESAFTGVVASIIFVYSSHAFPAMGWHTVDGIFFSVIALYFLVIGLKESNWYLFLSACFAILAAGSKQPYYLTPIIIWALSFIIGYKPRKFYVVTASLLIASFLFLLIFSYFGSIDSMREAISSQTSLSDLFSAGVKNYVSDLIKIKSIVVALPLLAVLAIGIFSKKNNLKFETIALLSLIFMFLVIIGQFYFSLEKFDQPTSIFDSVFVVTMIYSFLMVIKTREDKWIIVFSMHIMAWASSISWGYLTSILYAAPSVITLAFNLRLASETYLVARIASIVILPISVLIFYIGNQYTYSLEGPVHRSSITADMEEISPTLKYIKSETKQLELYRELKKILIRFDTHPYVVLPNMPLAHMLTNSTNPIGIDWLLNAEVGKNEVIIKDRLSSLVGYAIVYKNANPKPESSGKFGSNITLYVIKNWKLIESSENFSIFENPLIFKISPK